ncbi:MAG: peptidoglycan DD-metalloendopeptidase family protein [Gammaproteobacteria bacterium]|nr:MAG: peptidoglycan DD-metalloendopeptidase family protein [Gammaproteobacteria bacterium]
MRQTQNHNRDFKEPESRRYVKKVWYGLLPLTLISTIMLYPDRNQDSDSSGSGSGSVDQTIIQLTDESFADSDTISDESLSTSADKQATKHQPESSRIPMLADALTGAGSGVSFKPLLEKSPDLWKSSTIRKGDTLYIILKRFNLNVAAATLVARSGNSDQLVRLTPGRTLHILSSDGSSSDAFIYENSPLTWIYASKNGSSYDISSKKLPTTAHIRKVKGEVISSLYAAAKVVGISDTLTMNMTEIFGWDIDFAINVQPGDRFKLIFEDVYVDGSKKTHGDILAAEFINNGKTYRAIAHRDDDGVLRYYSPDGRSMQKTFLRTPVKFSRVSSRFSRARYHPVLKRTRAHKGVDYAAGRGTPVRATATGRIAFAGRKGGYGNAVVISHGSTYSTLYAHMSSFSRGIAKGSKVKQGQVIGRVGSTGLASGPHLHYEFRVNGKYVNPLTFRQPVSKPIQQSQKADFERSARYWEEQLDTIDSLNIAAGMSTSGS